MSYMVDKTNYKVTCPSLLIILGTNNHKYLLIKKNMSYTLFNEAIINSAQQSAMINRQCNKGWFHYSKSTLTPALAARNAILHSIRADQHPTSQETLMNLKTPPVGVSRGSLMFLVKGGADQLLCCEELHFLLLTLD